MENEMFDAKALTSAHLMLPAIVTSDGLVGRFDTLRAALEHLQSHGVADTSLSIMGDRALVITGSDLTALVDAFYEWPTAPRL